MQLIYYNIYVKIIPERTRHLNFCLKYNINDNKLLFKTKKVKSRDNS